MTGTPLLPQHRLAQAPRPQVRAFFQAFCARRARHCQLRQGVHQRGAHRQLRRGTYAQSNHAAAIRRLVVQQARGGTRRCWWQYLAKQGFRSAIDFGIVEMTRKVRRWMSKNPVVVGGDDNDEIRWTQSGKNAGRKIINCRSGDSLCSSL